MTLVEATSCGVGDSAIEKEDVSDGVGEQNERDCHRGGR